MRKYIRAGAIAVAVLFLIDSALISLGAFRYLNSGKTLGDLPVPYLVSGMFGGITAAYFFPEKNALRIPYVLLISLAFVVLELIMEETGHFQHLNWSYTHSFVLNVFGFLITLSLWQWSQKSTAV